MSIIEKIKRIASKLSSKKAEQLGPINDEEAITDQSKDIIELGKKPKEIIEQEKKDKQEDIEERENPSITVTGQEQDTTVTKEDDEAFDYFVEQLQSGKKVDDAIQLTDNAFYKPESLITRLAYDIKYGERKWIKINNWYPVKPPKGFVSVYLCNAEGKEAVNNYPENSNLPYRVYSLFKRGCRITLIASYNDVPEWYKKAQRYGDGFPVVWVEEAVRAIGLTGRAKTFFENFATSCEGGTGTDENNLGYDMSLYRYKASDVGKIYKAWKLLKDRKKITIDYRFPEKPQQEAPTEQQDESLPEPEPKLEAKTINSLKSLKSEIDRVNKKTANISDATFSIWLNGIKTTGDPEEAVWYVEEQLTFDEAEELEKFAKWLVSKGKTVGWRNYREVYNEFKNDRSASKKTAQEDLESEITRICKSEKISREDFPEKVDWFYISKYQKLSESFIREFEDKVNWNRISLYQKLSESFIREFEDKVDWYWVSEYQKLSEEFIREFQDKVDWYYISEYQKLSPEFKEEFKDRLGSKYSKTSIIKKTSEEYDKEIKSNWKVYWNQKNQQYDIQETEEPVYEGAQVFESLPDALECKKDLRASLKFLKISVLVQKKNKNTDRTEWALVSKSDPKKILKWFGPSKPNKEQIAKEEKRVQYFKNKGTTNFLSDKIDIGDTISVNESDYSTVIATSKDGKGVFTDNGIDVEYVLFDKITGTTKVKI